MNEAGMFFQMGVQHITNRGAVDHIAFVTALCLTYLWSDWKKLLVLVTAFTIGHSVTLALSTLKIINIRQQYTEFLIALTIIITAFNNFSNKQFHHQSKYPFIYFMALFFGLIHGLGFSAVLRSGIFGTGDQQQIIVPLLSFNLGLEAGQLFIITIVLLVSWVFISLLHTNRRDYVLFVSGGIAALAFQLAIERFPVKNSNYEKTAFRPVGAGYPVPCCCPGHPQQPGV